MNEETKLEELKKPKKLKLYDPLIDYSNVANSKIEIKIFLKKISFSINDDAKTQGIPLI
jgi:hypothetical protein